MRQTSVYLWGGARVPQWGAVWGERFIYWRRPEHCPARLGAVDPSPADTERWVVALLINTVEK